jgi:hypothetical protein
MPAPGRGKYIDSYGPVLREPARGRRLCHDSDWPFSLFSLHTTDAMSSLGIRRPGRHTKPDPHIQGSTPSYHRLHQRSSTILSRSKHIATRRLVIPPSPVDDLHPDPELPLYWAHHHLLASSLARCPPPVAPVNPPLVNEAVYRGTRYPRPRQPCPSHSSATSTTHRQPCRPA